MLDWAQFLKDQTTAKAEGRQGPKKSPLVALLVSFNLVTNVVISEIFLYDPSERGRVLSKSICIGLREYLLGCSQNRSFDRALAPRRKRKQ